ncbi:hypothetical protein PsorP6_015527 [Peronosclerospora sorghi]|uniref:Uncharacterized protein n=1 Tax=Peronosclerospora sorghi TaxID=230839 RepID=A0ACC0WR63_9STRA|nr:hypothetical protein PsorP6_015527 [Peronosclerospora sorghi]
MSEGRLQHLLQPIRDLSKNWNIDLATELEEYMEKLENLSIAFEHNDEIVGDKQSSGLMNFAEAALLIQGTSVIYSRKVEYLHALVYQTLAQLSNQQETRQPRRENEETEGNEHPVDREDGLGVFHDPLPLYDELNEAKASHIRLKTVNQATDELEHGSKRGSTELFRSKSNIQASIALMGSLVPDERDHGETFKLLSCNLHASGVLLLDEASKKYLGVQATGPEHVFGETPGLLGGTDVATDNELPATTLDFNAMDVNTDEHEDEHEDEHGVDDCMDAEYDAEERQDEEPRNDENETQAVPDNHGGEGLARPVTYSMTTDEKDPWTPLDAYDASTSVVRPFKKGRSYPRVPAYKRKKASAIALSNKESVVGMEEEEQDGLSDPAFHDRFFRRHHGPQWASWVWSETKDENPLEKTCKRAFCRAPLLTKSCDELWQREAKWRALMRRWEAHEQASAQAVLLREQAMEEEEAHGNDPIETLCVSSATTARLDVAFQSDRNDHDEETGEDVAFENDLSDGDWEAGPDVHVPVDVSALTPAEAETATRGSASLSYEEICRQHLVSFMSGAEKYVRETDLSKQVTEWQDKLTPLLKQQDARPPFDIHAYGREILGRLKEARRPSSKKRARVDPAPDEDTSVPFQALVEGKSPCEVSRVFLASLQLANSGNVSLVHAQSAAEYAHVPFQMHLQE